MIRKGSSGRFRRNSATRSFRTSLDISLPVQHGKRPPAAAFSHRADRHVPRSLPHPDISAGIRISFSEIDWVYCLNRALRQSHHRSDEAFAALEAFAAEYLPFLLSLDTTKDDGLNDLHSLFGALCCVAELQAALPGTIRTEKPLRLVLDRRPFI